LQIAERRVARKYPNFQFSIFNFQSPFCILHSAFFILPSLLCVPLLAARNPARRIFAVSSLLVLAALFSPAAAQLNTERPAVLAEVGINPQFDAQIPLDLEFMDSGGERVKLAAAFDGKLPVILTMNYSNCPKLCSLQLNGLVDAMKKLNWTAGAEYRVLTVGIDPLESPERAQLTKQKYLGGYGRARDAAAWRFLVSPQEDRIRRVADTVGFRYAYDPATRQYAHAAALMICTPEGRVARYLGGTEYDPQSLRFALYEAAEGQVGSTWDEVLSLCFVYDEATGKYSFAARRAMQVAVLGFAVFLAAGLVIYWRRDAARQRTAQAQGTQ
jgi:protein SCO1/2